MAHERTATKRNRLTFVRGDLNSLDLPAQSFDAAISLDHPSEAGLAKQLLKFAEVVEVLDRELKPNLLTEYLYDLSKAFSTFYDRKSGVRVIDAEPEALRLSRLRLCDLTGRTLKLGLGLLGIRTLERM